MKKSANYREPVTLDKMDQPNAELGLVKQLVQSTPTAIYRYIPGSMMVQHIDKFRVEYKWFRDRILVNYNN